MMTTEDQVTDTISLAYGMALSEAKRCGIWDYEDLCGAALLGLCRAARDFSPERQIPFKNYAFYRIRGALRDELRAMRPIGFRRKNTWPQTYSLDPVLDPHEDGDAFSCVVHSIEHVISEDSQEIARFESHEELAYLLSKLPVRKREIVKLVLLETLKRSEIAEFFGVSASRISQLYMSSLQDLRAIANETRAGRRL